MASNIKFKRSAVQNRVPTTAQLDLGELALNTYDGKLYTEINTGSAAVVEIGSKLSSLVVDGANGAGGGDVVFHGATAGRDLTWDYSANTLKVAEEAFIKFGTHEDFQISHGYALGSENTLIDQTTGKHLVVRVASSFHLRSNQTNIWNYAQNRKFLATNNTSQDIKLYFNNLERITTTNDGADIGGTGSLKIPVGTTAQRSSSPVAGDLRYNTTTGGFEGYSTSWGELGGGGIGIGSTSTNPSSGVVANRIGVGFTDINVVGTGISVTGYGSTIVLDFNDFKPGSFNRSIHNYTATAGQTTFAGLNYNNSTKQIAVYLNGARLSADTYTATSGTTVVLDVGASVGDEVEIINIHINSDVDRKVNNYTATAGQTTFTGLSYNSSTELDVYLNGIRLASADYTATSGNTVVLAVGASVNDIVDIVSTGDGVSFRSTADASGDKFTLTNVGIGTDITPDKLNVRGNVNVVGVVTASTGFRVPDGNFNSNLIGIGNQEDFIIYHDTAHTYAENKVGDFRIQADAIKIRSRTGHENYIQADVNNAVRLYYDGVQKMLTSSTGINVGFRIAASGDENTYVNLGNPADQWQFYTGGVQRLFITGGPSDGGTVQLPLDNLKLQIGFGQDLELYHNATHSYLDNKTGKLHIRNNTGTYHGNGIHIQPLADEESIVCNPNGTVKLYYDNSPKFETTSAGAKVTGNLEVTGVLTYDDVTNIDSVGIITARSGVNVTGNITVSGTVDGRDVATDGTKLDGIEASATADQTASEILTLIKTVDGTGSGLDADTVDGIQGANFLRSDANDTANGLIQLVNGAQYPLDINGADNGKLLLRGSSNPYIRFREGNTDKAYIQWNANGWLQLSNEEDQSGIRIKDDIVFTQNNFGSSHKIWHEGNDGSGSGLDADTLDGVQGSSFVRSDADDTLNGQYVINDGADEKLILRGSSNPYIRFQEGTTNKAYIQWNSNGYIDVTNSETGERLRVQNGSNGLKYVVDGTAYKVWHEANDGSGSGLDADTLDGVQGSSFLRSDAADSFNSKLTWSGTAGNTALDLAASDGYGSFRVIRNNNASGTHADGMYIGYANNNSGVTRIYGGGSSSGHLLINGTGGNDLKFLGNTVFHGGNDGSGSGLDADTVDGVHASSFVRSDATDTITGNLTINSSMTFGSGSGLNLSTNDIYFQARVMNNPNSSNLADGMYIGYGNGNAGRTRIFGGGATTGGLDVRGSGVNDVKINGNTVWHAGNDGAGSGLDADLLDGISSVSFLRSDANDDLGAILSYTSNEARLQFTNSSYGQSLHIGGWDHGANTAGVSKIRNSNDNLHIDCGANGGLYLNYYSQRTIYVSDLIPRTSNTFDLGSGSNRFRNIYSEQLNVIKSSGNLSGTFVASNGLGTLEIGGSTGAFIDLKMPSSDDFDLRIGTSGSGGYINGNLSITGTVTPGANNTYDLGSTSIRWRNIFTNDLNLSNEGSANDVDGTWGNFTIQEGEDDLFLINKRNGKKYKFNLTEVS